MGECRISTGDQGRERRWSGLDLHVVQAAPLSHTMALMLLKVKWIGFLSYNPWNVGVRGSSVSVLCLELRSGLSCYPWRRRRGPGGSGCLRRRERWWVKSEAVAAEGRGRKGSPGRVDPHLAMILCRLRRRRTRSPRLIWRAGDGWARGGQEGSGVVNATLLRSSLPAHLKKG